MGPGYVEQKLLMPSKGLHPSHEQNTVAVRDERDFVGCDKGSVNQTEDLSHVSLSTSTL